MMLMERGINPVDDPRDFDTYYLYVFRCGPYHKIGITTDLERRKRGIETHNPFKIKRLLFRRFERKHIRFVERFIHLELKAHRHRGEWFTASLDTIKLAIRQAIKAVPERDREYEAFVARSVVRAKKERAKFQDSSAQSSNILV